MAPDKPDTTPKAAEDVVIDLVVPVAGAALAAVTPVAATAVAITGAAIKTIEEEKAAATQAAAEKGGEAAADAAKSVIENPPKEKLPNNKFTEIYEGIQEELKKSGSDTVNNGLALAAKIFYVLAKYYSVVGGFMPDSVANSLKEGSLKNEKLTEEQARKLKEHAEANNGPWTDANAEVAQDKYNNMTTAQASTRYVSSMLGLEELDDANLLAARLSHRTLKGNSYYKQYKQTDIASLTGMEALPKGTVILFKHGLTGDLISGYATGEGHQIAFFNAKKGSVEKFDLKTGKCSFGTLTFQLGLFPKFNTDAAFFKDKPGQLDSNLVGPIEQTSSVLKAAKAAYDSQKLDVVKGSGNPNASKAALHIVSFELLSKNPLSILEPAKKELNDMPESDRKTEFLEKFKAEIQGYKDYLDAESKSVQELIEKENAKITELESQITKIEEQNQFYYSNPMSIPEEEEGQPQMSIDSFDQTQTTFNLTVLAADKEKIEKIISAYEKLDKYIKKTAGEVEKYLS